MSVNGHSPSTGQGSAGGAEFSNQLERQLAVAQQITHTGSWEWELASGRVRWSDELYRICGLEPQSCEITFEGFLSRIHPEDRERVAADVRMAMERGGRFAHRERIVRPDGSVRELDSVGEVLRDAAGRTLGLIGTCRDVTEERRRDATIRLYGDIVRNVQIGLSVWRCDASSPDELILVASNPETERIAGRSLEGCAGRSMLEMFPGLSATDLPQTLLSVARDRRERELPRLRLFAGPEGLLRTFAAKIFALADGCVGLALEDVTQQTRSRELQATEQRVLELVASGAELETVLSTLVLAIQKHAPPAIASIQLLDPDGQRVRHVAGPSLPEAYNRAIEGERIGPAAGSCGTAAFLGRPVFVSDIETDPLWQGYRELALAHGLRACWSTPIHSSDGRVVGTFAMYYRQVRHPAPEDLELLARAAHVAGIAIQRKQLDDQMRALTAHIEAAREDERTAMAREIHDELGQSLTALKMDVAWVQRRAPTSAAATASEAIGERLESMSQLIDGVIDQVRRIAAQLRPGVLDDLGLGAAVEWLAQDFGRRFDIPCSVRCDVQQSRFDRQLSTAIFRILQETLTNVARHARATKVHISLFETHSKLRLEVEDDGVGIPAEALARPGSLGLLGIKERARRFGGSAAIESGAAGGTRVSVEVPLVRGRYS